jgi:hypothetical protein
MSVPTQSRYILTIAEAIAHVEGFYINGSVARRNNNPGNLRGWDKNLPKDERGFTEFPSRTAGFLALYHQIELNYNRGLTFYEFFAGKEGVYAGYAPASDNNNPQSYAQTVCEFLVDRGFTPLSVHNGIKAWWEQQTNPVEDSVGSNVGPVQSELDPISGEGRIVKFYNRETDEEVTGIILNGHAIWFNSGAIGTASLAFLRDKGIEIKELDA